jgi:hypothetical protein
VLTVPKPSARIRPNAPRLPRATDRLVHGGSREIIQVMCRAGVSPTGHLFAVSLADSLGPASAMITFASAAILSLATLPSLPCPGVSRAGRRSRTAGRNLDRPDAVT